MRQVKTRFKDVVNPIRQQIVACRRGGFDEQWELFIKNAGKAVIKDLENEEKAYKLKLAYEELISNIIRAATENKIDHDVTLKVYCVTQVTMGRNYLHSRQKTTEYHTTLVSTKKTR